MSVQHVTEQLPWQCSLVSSSLNKCIKPIYSRACARPWNSWNTPAWEHCPSPGPFQTHGDPAGFLQAACSVPRRAAARHPQQMCPGDGHRPGKAPAAELPWARARPHRLPTEGEAPGLPTAGQLSPLCQPRCATCTGQSWVHPLARAGAGGRKAQLRFPRGVPRWKVRGHFPAHPKGTPWHRGSFMAAGGCQHGPSDLQGLPSARSSPSSSNGSPGWAQHSRGRHWIVPQHRHSPPRSSTQHSQQLCVTQGRV